MQRRQFLGSLGATSAAVWAGWPSFARAGEAAPAGWRTFELITSVQPLEPSGVTRVWVPLPLMFDTDYQRRRGDHWSGNARQIHMHREKKYGAGMVYAEWAAREAAPTLEVVSRVVTRDRSVDPQRPGPRESKESAARLKLYLEPTRLIPTDGIVKETARRITQDRRSEVDKARALYEWVVENCFRDPKVRGCGRGDIKAMLETHSFGGKCADINALFVGLARASGLPAREVYGVRAAESKEFKSLGRSGDVSKAQHCRAEFYAEPQGWIPVDPADVRKVALEEPPAERTLADPLVQRAREKLFGGWEMNYVAYNCAHDVALPGAAGEPLPFLMYPQGETAAGRKDPLEPPAFKYTITAREIV